MRSLRGFKNERPRNTKVDTVITAQTVQYQSEPRTVMLMSAVRPLTVSPGFDKSTIGLQREIIIRTIDADCIVATLIEHPCDCALATALKDYFLTVPPSRMYLGSSKNWMQRDNTSSIFEWPHEGTGDMMASGPMATLAALRVKRYSSHGMILASRRQTWLHGQPLLDSDMASEPRAEE
jgi:hypothetical protein